MIFRPVSPVSPAGPPITNRPVGFTRNRVFSFKSSFGNTKEGKWLQRNAYKYGFIIRYPKGKQNITGYVYEPWHVRYVGADRAKKIYKSGLCLEEYYGITSKYK